MMRVPNAVLQAEYERLVALPSDINEHLPVLRQYVAKCEHVTELGVRWAVSSWGMLAGMPKRYIACDTHRHPAVTAVEAAAKANGIDYVFLTGNDLSVPLESTDFMFIDTMHCYAQLSKELTQLSSLAKKWIALHDTTTYAHMDEPGSPAGAKVGLWLAIEDLIARGGWKILERRTNNNGLTVLERI